MKTNKKIVRITATASGIGADLAKYILEEG